MSGEILERARAMQDQIVAWRRDIHAHPELGFRETRTARLVADELSSLGLEVEVGVGKTGVVARLGEGGPVIGIRADMDALPIQETTGLPFASQTNGVMHACGHDAHTAILLSVAHILTEMPDRPKGEIRFIFQPSEEAQDSEGKSGGMRMVEEDALSGVDRTIALHVSSEHRSGVIAASSGYVSAAVDTFWATIKGEGCHGASPHKGLDPIFITAQVINSIYGIRARRVDPVRPAIISIGALHGGDVNNVIPAEVKMEGTIRSFDEETRQVMLTELERAFNVARALGADYDLRLQGGYPSMYNDEQVTQAILNVTEDFFGADEIVPFIPMMGAEDFSYMQQKAPGMMFFLGVQVGDEKHPHHSPHFTIDESPLYRGAAVMAETACRLLKEGR